MEELLKEELGTKTLEKCARSPQAVISDVASYKTDDGHVFVKWNKESYSREMYEGEVASLRAYMALDEIRVPEPLKILKHPDGGTVLVLEHLDIAELTSHAGVLGQQLASVHLRNAETGKRMRKEESSVHRDEELKYVDKFGFDVVTYAGRFPQNSSWTDTWVEYLVRKIDDAITLLESQFGERSIRELWTQVLPSVPSCFEGITVEPSLLHGDLWYGNTGQVTDAPVIFDPSSFYGHAEFDLSQPLMFKSPQPFLENYFQKIPKAPGFENRIQLYHLFYHLNHWNHFGPVEHREPTMKTLNCLMNLTKRDS